ncbi:high affinity cGMP-specific 3',5'-cyclic phosphodiesterase 9A, partial [Strongylocentrotus purpuratus]|uniref:Phosphodiesterase n=1 Tax=Strongylocentrotus purpuratus TaxID=7668 RepID=A0A7M7P077_STRPU
SPLADVFRSAAEAGPNDILKLYNQKGNLVNISPKLEENTPDSRYKLDVVAAHCDGRRSVAEKLGFDIQKMESRLELLEKKVLIDGGEIPTVVYELRNKVEEFRDKLESVEHLSWLGLTKEFVASSTNHLPFYKQKLRKTQEEQKRVWEKFSKISHLQLTDDIREYLRQPTFDNWQWEDAEMMLLLQQMYIDLDFIAKFNIEMPILQNFLFEVFRHYNNVPFHNFKHCFCVSQMMYGIIWRVDLPKLIGHQECLVMITSAICHDLDHPGYNNAYQVNAGTELALRYNDISPLENHHCSVAFKILEKPHCNIFKNLSPEIFKQVREGIIRCILATDMAKHNEILNGFKDIISTFDFSNKVHKDLLTKICIKVADISNEARPMDVAEPWIDCLLQEFFNQSDMEKLEGLPVAPFMDREKVTKHTSQTGFIRFVLLPLFESLGLLFPKLDEHIIEPVRTALKYYSEMAQALEEEKKRTNERKDSLTNGSNTVTKKNIEANSTTSSSSSSLSHNGKRPGSGKGAPNNPHVSAVKDKKFVSKSPSPSSSATKSTTKTK